MIGGFPPFIKITNSYREKSIFLKRRTGLAAVEYSIEEKEVVPLHMQSLIESFLLAAALSIDSFVACFAYGTNKIKIPPVSVIIISSMCSIVLAVALCFGMMVRSFVPPGLTKFCCFAILFLLGIIRLFDSSIKAYIRKRKKIDKKFSFSALHLTFILNVYADPQEADEDLSSLLSPAEAVTLALALSIDSLAVGFGTALVSINFLQMVLVSFLTGLIAVVGGCFVGNKISQSVQNVDLSWLSGVLLIVLAILKL